MKTYVQDGEQATKFLQKTSF